MSARTRLFVLLATSPIMVFVILGGWLGKASARGTGPYPHLRVFEDVVSLIATSYVEEADLSKVLRGAMRGLAEGLDADSAYLPPAEAKHIESGAALPPGETGIELTRAYYLRIIAVRDQSPAARAGLRAGDFLRAIDGRPTREMSIYEGMRLLRGDLGTTVALLVIRGNAADPHTVNVTRERITGPDVRGRLEGGRTGYVRVASFGAGAASAVAATVADLAKSGASALVVDVRDTATGSYDAGLAVARLFVGTGTLGFKQMRGAARQPITAAAPDGAVAWPTVVLVNDGTSGAAEVFAAAMAGTKRAVLVGERSQGRAAVQKLVRLPDGSAMIISNGWYLTPAGDPIHERGLVPGVSVPTPDVEFGAAPPTTDPVLSAGLEHLARVK